MAAPSWWLIHLGEILAAVVMSTLVGMLAFIIYIDNQEKKEEEERLQKAQAKKAKEDANKSNVVQPKESEGKPLLKQRKNKKKREKSTSPERSENRKAKSK